MINNRNTISFEDSDIVFVNDIFADEMSGGAELTTDALFKSAVYKTYKLKSSDVTAQLISEGTQKTWVFFNFAFLDYNFCICISAFAFLHFHFCIRISTFAFLHSHFQKLHPKLIHQRLK